MIDGQITRENSTGEGGYRRPILYGANALIPKKKKIKKEKNKNGGMVVYVYLIVVRSLPISFNSGGVLCVLW